MKYCPARCIFSFFIIWLVITAGGCTRYFLVSPQKTSYEFTVIEKFGKLNYAPIKDSRNELDRTGQEPGACSPGEAGILVLGDDNYSPNKLLPEVNKYLKMAIEEAALFNNVSEDSLNVDGEYLLRTSLDQFHVVLNEAKAQQTQACVGGIVGAAIASAIDVEAATDIVITGYLYKGTTEIWHTTVTKKVLKIDDYSNTDKNAEASMNEGISEACKELITEMAKYLSTNS